MKTVKFEINSERSDGSGQWYSNISLTEAGTNMFYVEIETDGEFDKPYQCSDGLEFKEAMQLFSQKCIEAKFRADNDIIG